MKIAVSPENGTNAAGLVGGAFENARRGRADRNDPPAGGARAVQRLGRRSVERAPLAVHDMVFGVLRLHRQEGPRPDVQGDAMQGHAARRDPLDQPRR